MVAAVLIGLFYTLPNFYGDTPAVQVSSGMATVKVDSSVLQKVEDALRANNIPTEDISFDNNPTNASVRVRLRDTDTQMRV